GVNIDWPAWKYYGHDELIDKRSGLNYLMIFFLDDNNSEVIGVLTVYPQSSQSIS
ncbi:16309_t:CDS:2, partial [Racocetra persica]